ncbi:ABC transporter substrate-binding protein [Sporolactobacillus terrae]|uniref:ABC transporter substrate-binding protein n=1 Tax=Sporolactobacillus terrae TaxID=269673 RepID=UPI00048C7EB1|nr:ABC transporter substrate-binding protein [Sporolactobacillus terrae]
MKIKKIGACILSVVMIFSILSGCGNSNSSNDKNKKIQLTMWQQWGGGHEEAVLKKVIREYERLHPNITIKEIPVTDNSKILTAISGGNPPDIIDLGSSATIGEWASKGALTNLTPYINKDKDFKKDAFVPASWKPVTYKGNPYGLPFMNFNVGLLYNKKLLASAGLKNPPSTLEELTKYADKLTKVNSKGKITQMGFLPNYPGQTNGQVVGLENYGWIFGGDWFDTEKNKATADRSENVKALNWESEFYKKYGAQNVANFEKSAGAYLTAQDLFESGKLAMVYDGPWALAYIKQNVPSLSKDIGVAPFPAPVSNSSAKGTTFIDTNAQVIPTGSKHVQEAYDFIAWETSNPKIASTFADLINNLPQLKKVPEFKLAKDKRFKVFMDLANSKNAHAWVQSSVSGEYTNKLAQTENDVLMGKAEAKSALEQLNSSINSSLGK